MLEDTEKRTVFEELKHHFAVAEEDEADNRADGLKCLHFANGDQWETRIKNERTGRPAPVVNKVETYVRRLVNSLRSMRPRIAVHPTGDGARTETAETVNGLERHIENRSNADVAYDMAAESAVRIGWGYCRILTEYIDEKSFDQEIKIEAIRNVFTVYMDPAAKDPTACDARWCIITGKMKRDTYKALYPNADNAQFIMSAAGDSDREWENRDEIRLAEYYRVREKPEKLYMLQGGGTAFESEFEADADRQFIAKDAQGKEIFRDSFKRTVEWYKFNGTAQVAMVELPGRNIPVFRCEGNVLDLDGKVIRKGVIHDMMDPQRTLNYMKASQIERLALTPKAPWTAFEEQLDGHPEWYDANQKNYSVLVHKAVYTPEGQLLPPPVRQQPAAVEQGFLEAMQSADSDLMAIAGMPHEPGQDTQGQVVSGKAIQRRQQLSDMTHYQFYDNQKRMIAEIGRCMLEWIPVIYDTQRQQRIIGGDDMPQMVQLNQPSSEKDENGQTILTVKNDMTIGRYDVVMDTGPGYQTQREEGAENLMTLVGTPELGKKISDIGADLVVRSIDGPYMQELADRLASSTPAGMQKMVEGLPKQAQSVVKALQAQLQQAQQKVQELETDLKAGLTKTLHQEATKLQIANMNDQTKKEDTHSNTFTKLEDTHTRAHTSIAVAEIGAGARLIDSNQDRTHEKDLARMTAETAEKAERVN